MNKLIAQGQWNVIKGRLKQKYGNLTDDDLRYAEGRDDELYGRLQKATGETRENLERFIHDEPAGVSRSAGSATRADRRSFASGPDGGALH